MGTSTCAGTTRRAKDTAIDSNSIILADATDNGNGGQVTIAGTTISFVGQASAQGGPNGGNGGSITLFTPGSNAVAGNDAADKNGQATSLVEVSGTLNSSAYGSGGQGGTIQVLGDDVGILTVAATINANGATGGYNYRIGGDFHGEGTTPTAIGTDVEAGSTILANAIDNGNGGYVTVWSDYYANFAGNIEAR